jgi:hypothetical protein
MAAGVERAGRRTGGEHYRIGSLDKIIGLLDPPTELDVHRQAAKLALQVVDQPQ